MIVASLSLQEAIREMVETYGSVPVTVLIHDIERAHPGQRVRTAYWMLMTSGDITTDSSGMVRLTAIRKGL